MDHQGSHAPVRLFFQRNIVYKMGFIAIIISFILYAHTFISSNWISITDDQGRQVIMGIWSLCRHDCNSNHKEEIQIAIRTMACICITGYLLTIIIGLIINCRRVSPIYHSRKVEWLALFTGTVGILMDLTYIFVYFMRHSDASLKMDFMLNSLAVFLVFLAVTMIACNNRNPQAGRGRIVCAPPQSNLVVQYDSGRQCPTAPPMEPHMGLHYAPPPHQPFLPPQHYQYPYQHHPPMEPPPYTLPPSYPGENWKASS